MHVDDDINFDLPIEIPTLKKRIERFNRHLLERGEASADRRRHLPLRPVRDVRAPARRSRFLLKVLYLGPRRRYPDRPRLYSEHLVFAAHNTAFLSIGIIAATVAPFGVLRAAVIVWILVYLRLVDARRSTAGSWVGIAARAFVIFITYSILFGLVTAGLVIAAVVLR